MSNDRTALADRSRLAEIRTTKIKKIAFRGDFFCVCPKKAVTSDSANPAGFPNIRSSMCSEWGLLALARRTYSSINPPDFVRCGSFASCPHYRANYNLFSKKILLMRA